MARFYSFSQFLLEKELAVSPALREYVVQDLGEGKFEMEKDNSPVQFSVNPVPKDLTTYRVTLEEIIQAVESNIPYRLYEIIQKIENLPYKFGNVFTRSLSLSNVDGLDVTLTDAQRIALKASEKEFLKSEFASLSQQIKDAVISYLKDIAEMAAVVLECLFYYTKNGDKEEFFEGKNFDEMIKTYQDIIESCKEKDEITFDGPYDSDKLNNEIDSPKDFVFWKINLHKKESKYILRAPTSPKILNADDNVGKKAGLNFTILSTKLEEISKDYTRFPAEELKEKLTSLENNDKLDEMSIPSNEWIDWDLTKVDTEGLDIIWKMYTDTYSKEGLDFSANDAQELQKKYKAVYLKDVDYDHIPDAFIIYKETPYGNKIALSGTDNKKEAKRECVKKIISLLHTKGWFVEASAKIEEILSKTDVPVITDEEMIRDVVGKHKEPIFGKDGYYTRLLTKASKRITKRMYGIIK